MLLSISLILKWFKSRTYCCRLLWIKGVLCESQEEAVEGKQIEFLT